MTKDLTKEEESQSLQILERPDYITGGNSSKDMDISAEDIKFSYLTVGQAMSNADQDGSVKKGEICDSITRKNFGDSVDIIILKQSKVWKLFENRKLIKTSSDGEYWRDGTPLSPDEQWQTKNIIFFVLIKSHLESFPMSLGFKSTDIKSGESLMMLLHRNKSNGKEAIYARSYTLISEEIDSPGGKSFKKCIKSHFPYLNKKEFEYAKTIYEEIEKLNLTEDSYVNQKEEESETDKVMDKICEPTDQTDEITLN